MGQINKIEKHNLQGRCLALFREGRTTAEIADILTQELAGVDTISQPSVSRWLKPIRDDERDETRKRIHDHIKQTVESDLEILDEVEGFMVQEFRNPENSVLQRSDFGLKALRVVETKLKYALTDPTNTQDTLHPVDLESFRNDLEDLRQDRECQP